MCGVARVVRLTETQSRMAVARGWGGRDGELQHNGMEFQFGKIKVPDMDDADGCTAMCMYLVVMPLNYALENY